MDKTPVETSVRQGRNGGLLRNGGGNPLGTGGRPPEEFRRKAGEQLDHWLDRACQVLTELQEQATEYDEKVKFVESARKLGETFGKYTGLEKSEVVTPPAKVVVNFGDMTAEQLDAMLEKLPE